MATTVIELDIAAQGANPNIPTYWALNISSDNASTAQVIKAAETGKRHWIENVIVTCVTANADTDWFRLLDGDDNMIGHIVLAKGVPWSFKFAKPICGTIGTALKIKTATDFGVHVIVEGFTDP